MQPLQRIIIIIVIIQREMRDIFEQSHVRLNIDFTCSRSINGGSAVDMTQHLLHARLRRVGVRAPVILRKRNNQLYVGSRCDYSCQ